MKRDSKKDDYKDWIKEYSRIGYIAFFFPVCIFLGYLSGNWLDKKFGSKPVLTLILIVAGFAAALRTLLREIDRVDDDERKK